MESGGWRVDTSDVGMKMGSSAQWVSAGRRRTAEAEADAVGVRVGGGGAD
jgi:hypothetical protein